MYRILFVFLIFFDVGNTEEDCPAFIKCETSEEKDSCPPGSFYRQKAKVHGCCPGCIRGLKGENQDCQSSADCEPGLRCNSMKKCEGDPDQACEYYKRFDPILKKTGYWKPDCLPDGSFAPKQCKGEKMAGKCFCVDGLGKRIFGEEEWAKAGNMTCGCSRLVEEMRKRAAGVSFHCDRLGNFEPLQCDQKVCWCATPATGVPYTASVPLEMMVSLPCYNGDGVGAQYYRRCDSAEHMKEVAKKLLSNHGSGGIVLGSDKCDFNGGFHRVQALRGKKRCVFVNNALLTEAVESTDANCNCAYDRHVAQSRGAEFNFDCHSSGNYRRRVVWNEKVHCIDDDGFYYSDDERDCLIAVAVAE